MSKKKLEKKFKELSLRIRNHARFTKLEFLIQEAAYKELIAMGKDILPLLIQELEVNPEYWFHALKTITSQNPIKRGNQNKNSLIANDWKEWFQSQNGNNSVTQND
jgi:hypothetical protein